MPPLRPLPLPWVCVMSVEVEVLLGAASQQGCRAREALVARDAAVAKARRLGASYGQIAEALGITKAGAQALVRRLASQHPPATT